MNRDGSDGGNDVWAQIEELISRESEKILATQILDTALQNGWVSTEHAFELERLFRMKAREIGKTAVKNTCDTLGGQVHCYIPKVPRHHRAARDEQLRKENHGDPAAIARTVDLSVRQVRRILVMKK